MYSARRIKTQNCPTEEDLYPVGVFAKLIKVIKMPGTDQMSIIIQGLGRCQMKHLVQKEPYTVIDVKSLPEKWPDENNDELFRMLYENFHYEATDYIKSNANYNDDAIQAINELSSIHMQCNFMCSLLPFSIEGKNQDAERGKSQRAHHDCHQIPEQGAPSATHPD